jgi:hypothetical protein
MAEHDDWTAADDAGLRAALASLRTDVEAVPLPDVRFVKARGMARRRRRFLAVGAAAAVAAIVAGTVGYDVLRPDGNVVHLPAARTSTTSAAPSPTTTPSSLDQPGALPLLQEWVKTLGLEGDARMTTQDPKSGDYRSFECLTIVPEGQKLRQEITLDAGGFQGGQAQFAVSTGQKPATVARGLTNAISQCQQGQTSTSTGSTRPTRGRCTPTRRAMRGRGGSWSSPATRTSRSSRSPTPPGRSRGTPSPR